MLVQRDHTHTHTRIDSTVAPTYDDGRVYRAHIRIHMYVCVMIYSRSLGHGEEGGYSSGLMMLHMFQNHTHTHTA